MSQPRIHNAMELETLVQQMGFLPFFACSVPNFSIEEFTFSRYWFMEDGNVPWKWRMEVACRDVVAYGKLFPKKAGLVSLEWYPDLVNYRCNGDNFDARYKVGMAGYREKCAVDVLLREGSMLSKALKRMAGFGTDGPKGLDTVMANLQMQTYVTVHSFEYAHDKFSKPYAEASPTMRCRRVCLEQSDAGGSWPQPGRIQGDNRPTFRDATSGCC